MNLRTPEGIETIERVLAGYLECAAWTDAPEGGHARFPKTEIAKARNQCAEFITACGELFDQALEQPGYSPERFGHDFWLNRCGHGAGFWDRDELESPVSSLDLPEGATPALLDRDGQVYGWQPGATLGEALSAIAYGTDKAISRFAYASLDAYRGWLYFL